MRKNTLSPHLTDTIAELEKAFADWEKLAPDAVTAVAIEKIATQLGPKINGEDEVMNRARALLAKLKKQILELDT